jgi:uncharacterized protein YxjI
MDLEQLQTIPRFTLRQKITPMVNRYVVAVANDDGSEGAPVGFAEQKRMKLKEEVVVYSDESRTLPLFRFKARQVFDLGATYDVTSPDGGQLGTFRKLAGKSLLRSTWELEQNGQKAIGQERSPAVAIIRRVWEMASDIPFFIPYHFDFTAEGGTRLMSVDKTTNFRDRYLIEVHEPALDRRLAIAMAVALDALQSR